MREIIILLLTLAILINCNSRETKIDEYSKINDDLNLNSNIKVDTLSKFEISFKEKFIFSAILDSSIISIGDFDVDKYSRVYISDRRTIKIFSPNGQLIKILGGKGRGPGEFNSFSVLRPMLSKNRLFVYDDVLLQINVFDINTFELYKTILIEPQKWQKKSNFKKVRFKGYHIVNDSTLLVGLQDVFEKNELIKTKYFLMNLDGELVSSLILSHSPNILYEGRGVPGPIKVSNALPFPNPSTRSYLVNVDRGSNVYSIWNNEFKVDVINAYTNRSSSISFDFQNSKLESNNIINIYEKNRIKFQRAKLENYPSTWPAINNFFIDDKNRLWIATIVNSEEYYEWLIINAKGDLMAKFKWEGKRLERHKEPLELVTSKNGFLYTIEKNSLTLEHEIKKYEIILSEKQ